MLHHITYEMVRTAMAVREREGARMRLVRTLRRQRPVA